MCVCACAQREGRANGKKQKQKKKTRESGNGCFPLALSLSTQHTPPDPAVHTHAFTPGLLTRTHAEPSWKTSNGTGSGERVCDEGPTHKRGGSYRPLPARRPNRLTFLSFLHPHAHRGTLAFSSGDAAGAAACFRAALAALPPTQATAPARYALLCNLSAAALACRDARAAVAAARGAVAECRKQQGGGGGERGAAACPAKPLYRLGLALTASGAHSAAVAALSAADAAAPGAAPVQAALQAARVAVARADASKKRTASTPPAPPAARPPSSDILTAAATLGLPLDRAGDKRAIRRAYLQSATAAHPDRGGTSAAFGEVRAAYEVLRAARRAGLAGEGGDSASPASVLTASVLPPPAEIEAEFRARHAVEAAAAEAEAAQVAALDPARAVELLTAAARAARAAGGGPAVARVLAAREAAVRACGGGVVAGE